jgi:hypothetical protein
MTSKTDACDFMHRWIACNVDAHPSPEDLAPCVLKLTRLCLTEATASGLSGTAIELETGSLVAVLIFEAVQSQFEHR